MGLTAGIKMCLAVGTNIFAGKVCCNRKLVLANTAKYGLLCPILFRPSQWWMISKFLVALKAGIVSFAAFKLYRDNVQDAMIMFTAALLVN